MDPITIAASVVAALTPYLAKAAGKFAEKAAEKLGESSAEAGTSAVGDLYKAIKARFAHSPEATEQLTDLEKAPDDADNQAAVRKLLKKTFADDADFLKAMGGLLEQAGSRTDVHFQNQFGQVGTVNQFGTAQTVNIGRD